MDCLSKSLLPLEALEARLAWPAEPELAAPASIVLDSSCVLPPLLLPSRSLKVLSWRREWLALPSFALPEATGRLGDTITLALSALPWELYWLAWRARLLADLVALDLTPD